MQNQAIQTKTITYNPFLAEPIGAQQKTYTSIELFAGAGGLALGFEQAGFKHILLNEVDKHACNTLRFNRPNWPVLCQDIKTIDFTPYQNKVDVVAGGFPCQAFSIAGQRKGFDDKNGQLFFEFVRAIREIKPKLFIGENVKGLLFHNKGKTIETIVKTLTDAGYDVVTPKLLKAIHYRVPQRRERVFIVGIRNDINADFHYPEPDNRIYTVADALKAGRLYDTDVPDSISFNYSPSKVDILKKVPPGGNWKDLPVNLQKIYMGNDFGTNSGTQIARRLSWDKPCYTLLTKPLSKRTDRCHPEETRPLTVRESARIQTFPDDWQFVGSRSAQYAQIGNAVPINLAKAIGLSAIDCLKRINDNRSKSVRQSLRTPNIGCFPTN